MLLFKVVSQQVNFSVLKNDRLAEVIPNYQNLSEIDKELAVKKFLENFLLKDADYLNQYLEQEWQKSGLIETDFKESGEAIKKIFEETSQKIFNSKSDFQMTNTRILQNKVLQHFILKKAYESFLGHWKKQTAIFVFGSGSRGGIHQGSDLDYGCLYDPSLSKEQVEKLRQDYMEMYHFLEKKVGIVLDPENQAFPRIFSAKQDFGMKPFLPPALAEINPEETFWKSVLSDMSYLTGNIKWLEGLKTDFMEKISFRPLKHAQLHMFPDVHFDQVKKEVQYYIRKYIFPFNQADPSSDRFSAAKARQHLYQQITAVFGPLSESQIKQVREIMDEEINWTEYETLNSNPGKKISYLHKKLWDVYQIYFKIFNENDYRDALYGIKNILEDLAAKNPSQSVKNFLDDFKLTLFREMEKPQLISARQQKLLKISYHSIVELLSDFEKNNANLSVKDLPGKIMAYLKSSESRQEVLGAPVMLKYHLQRQFDEVEWAAKIAFHRSKTPVNSERVIKTIFHPRLMEYAKQEGIAFNMNEERYRHLKRFATYFRQQSDVMGDLDLNLLVNDYDVLNVFFNIKKELFLNVKPELAREFCVVFGISPKELEKMLSQFDKNEEGLRTQKTLLNRLRGILLELNDFKKSFYLLMQKMDSNNLDILL